MTFGKHGADTSHVEVTKVSQHGLWLSVHDREVFLPFEDFPWFKDVPAEIGAHVELVSAEHLYWPELDVNLELESILHPERYPLVSGAVHEAGEVYSGPGLSDEDTDQGFS